MTADVNCHLHAVISCLPVFQHKLSEIKMETQRDEQLQMVERLIVNGWPKYTKSVPNSAQNFYKWKDFLTVTEGLIVLGNRIVILKIMRQEMQSRIHDRHQGLSKCRAHTRDCMEAWNIRGS